MTASSPSPYAEAFTHSMKCLAELEATWQTMADRGAIDPYVAHKHIREIGMARESILDDYFA